MANPSGYNLRNYDDPHYKPGQIPKAPRNTSQHDGIICKAYTLISGPIVREYCYKEMVLMKRQDVNTIMKVECMESGIHPIASGYEYVAACHNIQSHITGEPHIICKGCLETYQQDENQLFEIRPNYYKYIPKKRKQT